MDVDGPADPTARVGGRVLLVVVGDGGRRLPSPLQGSGWALGRSVTVRHAKRDLHRPPALPQQHGGGLDTG
jgi:hypothetical protein